MTISTRIRDELFTTQSGDEAPDVTMEAPSSPQLIRLPLSRPPDGLSSSKKKKMAKKKAKQMTTTTTKYKVKAVPVQPVVAMLESRETPHRHGLPWTIDEHDRFLQGLELYPSGPWKAIAAYVGTRTPRQTMTHAQKYRQKIQRRRRGLMTSSRQPVPVTSEAYGGLVITTNVKDCEPAAAASPKKSPTAVDADERVAPLQSNWFDKVEVGELDAAFRAFLEAYEPVDDEEHTNAFNSTFAMEDGTSIVL